MEQCCLLSSQLAGFQLVPPLPTSKLGPSRADSRVGGVLYSLGCCGTLQRTLLWGWEFLPPLQPPQVFIVRGFEALFPHTGTLGFAVCLAPQVSLLVYLHANVGPGNFSFLINKNSFVIQKCTIPRTTRTILKKNKLGGLSSLNFKTNYKAVLTKLVLYLHRINT